MQQRKRSAKDQAKRGKGKPRGGNVSQTVVEVPGQELERAAADVGREAGKSILRGLSRLCGARFAGWLAENEAKAKAVRMAIDTAASIDRGKALTAERRQQELEEIDHQEAKALAERRLNWLLIEMAREQANFEAIAVRSLKQIEHHPEGDKTREIDDDWMFKFARYAQDVSDREIQELWARILASAAIEGQQRVSAAALQSMSLMDKRAAKDFEKFSRVWATFGFYPTQDHRRYPEPQDINLGTLRELGLIEGRANLKEYSFPEFDMKLGRPGRILDLFLSCMYLTQRGTEITNALFQQRTDMLLDDELVMKYLKNVVSSHLDQYPVNIFPKINGQQAPYVIQVSKRAGAQLPDVSAGRSRDQDLPDQLSRLIDWLGGHYTVARAPNPSQ